MTGREIHKERLLCGLSQRDLGELTGVGQGYISDIEQDKKAHNIPETTYERNREIISHTLKGLSHKYVYDPFATQELISKNNIKLDAVAKAINIPKGGIEKALRCFIDGTKMGGSSFHKYLEWLDKTGRYITQNNSRPAPITSMGKTLEILEQRSTPLKDALARRRELRQKVVEQAAVVTSGQKTVQQLANKVAETEHANMQPGSGKTFNDIWERVTKRRKKSAEVRQELEDAEQILASAKTELLMTENKLYKVEAEISKLQNSDFQNNVSTLLSKMYDTIAEWQTDITKLLNKRE